MSNANNINCNINSAKDKPFEGLRVLVVEDNRVNQIVAKGFLEDFGCIADIAENGNKALAMFDNNYDFVLLDLGLPDIDGCEVCAKIREKNKTIPVIVCTASYGAFKDKCSNSGINDYIEKPIDQDLLKKSIQQQVLKLKER